MQRTLMYEAACSGVCLHSGKTVCMRVRPAPASTGVVFRRIDLDPVVSIPAKVENVSNTLNCTAIRADDVEIQTIEHLLSVFAGYGIDNAYIDIDGTELPAMDGSGSAFVLLVKSAGIQEQDTPKKFIKIKKKLSVTNGDKYATLLPADDNSFSIKFSIDFNKTFNQKHPLVAIHDFSTSSFVQQICRARTFGFDTDLDKMRTMGLARGANEDNAIMIKEDGSIGNNDGLRFANELVHHKILDAYGDLFLLGHGLLGRFESHKSGHALNNKLLKKLLAERSSWEIVEFKHDADLQIRYDYFPIAVDS